MGRRVWSDERVAALMPRFVLAADEVWRLQNDDDPECRFFRRHVRGDETRSAGSMQGTYVFAPSGRLLASRNTNDPGQVAALLERALAAWDDLAPEERGLRDPSQVAAGFRWEASYPADGLVLRRTARDLPADGDPSATPTGRFNRDAVWFSADEARALLPADPTIGARRAWPDALTKRMSCLVLVDNVGGQTIPYHPSEDTGSRIASEVTGVDGARVTLAISGRTGADAPGPWRYDPASDWAPPADRAWPHAIATTLSGVATYDLEAQRFVAFELVALGERRGRTVNQARPSADPSPIGFLCELATADWRVPPTFIDVYDADWVARPD